MTRAILAALVALLGITSCAGNSASATGQAGLPQGPPLDSARTSSKYIKHVIVMIQENRSFNDFFATFPGADGTTKGTMKGGKTIELRKADLGERCDFGHSYNGFVRDYDGGKMDGFSLEGGSGNCPGKAGTAPYQYVKPAQIAPYWDIAKQYVLADHMFQTQGSGSYTAHQDLIRGSTTIDEDQTESLVDFPSRIPWGCDAPKSPPTVTSLLVWNGSALKNEYHQGPFPCSNDFPSSGAYYETLRDLLDAKGVSWKYYSPPVKNGVGGYWNAFDTIYPVRYGSEWGTNVTDSDTLIFSDIKDNTLPAMSWLIPDAANSDHPGSGRDTGPSWVASVVNAVGESSYWDSTVVIVLWDDWGGFYDNLAPPFFDHWGGLGFRVPTMVVSAYARKGSSSQGGYVSQTQYEFGSILKFIENNWNLGRLGTTDARATSIVDCFDFTQAPRAFKKISSKYSRTYFERQPPSYQPVDTE